MNKRPVGILFCVLLINSVVLPVTGELNGSQSEGGPFDGYILFAPAMSSTSYLINISGEVVHTWNSAYNPRFAAYLLETGLLLRTAQMSANPIFNGGGAGGGVEKIDWSGNVVWGFEYSTDQHCLHHDIEGLPNGNVLMIAWEYKTAAEAIAAGRDPALVINALWPDHIIEVEPTGATGGNIVWEWYVWDHLIQDYDPAKENYGVVADHPELIDVNLGVGHDWNHINSVDHNEEFDQILLSVHALDEIWVIDHSTTTQEAAGHTGGNSGRGGDILYRWGNPQAYRAGSAADQKFFRQHDAWWVEPGLPGEGNILVFNNGARRPGGEYSTVDEIVPPVDSSGNYSLTPGTAYGPEDQVWIYTADPPGDFFAVNISGAQRLPDGNTLITDGPHGFFFEVTPVGDIVWEYDNLFPTPSQSRTFKALRYAPDYPGLELLVNDPPQRPGMPDGPVAGEVGIEYQYSTSTTDPEGDQIYYLFDWGDDTDSTWIGPHASGATAEASHAWTTQGSYEIKVIAKDEDDALSEWSDSLPVSLGALCGDPNEDGVTNVGDVVYLVSYLYKGGLSPQPTDCVGDANNDAIVNVGDVVYLVAYLYGGGPAPDPNCCNPPWKK